MVWHKNKLCWFTKATESGISCALQNVPYRDTFAWWLRIQHTATGEWLDYGYYLSANLGKQHALKIKNERWALWTTKQPEGDKQNYKAY